MNKLDFHWVENTWTYVNKKRIPQSIEKNAEFYFIEKQEDISNKSDAYFVTIINDNFSEEDLLNEYYTKFKFPYFGFNWDALEDCLRDLDWIEQINVIVYHERLPALNQRDMETYLDILRGTVAHWKQYEEHIFEVYFKMQDYEKVQKLIE